MKRKTMLRWAPVVTAVATAFSNRAIACASGSSGGRLNITSVFFPSCAISTLGSGFTAPMVICPPRRMSASI